jgi:glycosyltransferase involved in cell wall biosynthesis
MLPLRRLVTGPSPAPDRVLFTEVWFRGHNNQRYFHLLPRLERLDRYHFLVSDRRVLRGSQFRALRATAPARHRAVFAAARRRGYRFLLTCESAQIDYFRGAVLADCDDASFSPEEVERLKRPNVRAFVVVNDVVARRYAELGVEKPCYVIPHGVSLRSLNSAAVSEVASRHRGHGELVVGYMASWLLSTGDRAGGNLRYNVDHLLRLWDELHARLPHARLWLLGGASKRVRRRCAGRHDILLFGRIPPDRVLSYVANFDVALYPRAADEGYQASKVVEYMGCGVPTVSYDYAVTADLRDSGAGLLVDTPREFVAAVERLAVDDHLHGKVAAAARAAGAARDFDVLARRYAAILDRHL